MIKCPFLPEQDSYSAKYGEQIVSIDLDGGLPRQRKDFDNAASSFTVKWILDRAKFEKIQSFYRAYVRSGGAPFLIDLILDDSGILEYTAVIVADSWSFDSIEGFTYTVSCELKVEYKDWDTGYILMSYDNDTKLITGSTWWHGRKIGNIPVSIQVDGAGTIYNVTSSASGDFTLSGVNILPGTHILNATGTVNTDFEIFKIYGETEVYVEGTLLTVIIRIDDLTKPVVNIDADATTDELYIKFNNGEFTQNFTKGTLGQIYTTEVLTVGQEYTMQILGSEYFSFYNIRQSSTNTNPLMELVSLVSPTLINFGSFASGHTTLRKIHDTALQDAPAIKYVDAAFEGCTGLTAIPAALFSGKPLTSAPRCFYGCTGLTALPANLFYNCNKCTDFGFCFNGCTGLTTVPVTTFGNCTAAITFTYCFNQCTSITSVPADLFASCVNATTFNLCFYLCSKLSTVPATLFSRNTKATTFASCFAYCGLTSIPATLFTYNTLVTTFNNCFMINQYLTETPANLFSTCINATNFQSCFMNCAALVTINAGLFKNCAAATNFNYCFQTCAELVTLPADMFSGCTSAQTFSYTFQACSKVVSIPSGLLTSCVNATSFNNFFRMGTVTMALTTIPVNLFATCTKTTTVFAIFWGTSIATLPAGLFKGLSLLSDASYAFYNCQSLSNIPVDTFSGCSAVTTFSSTFYFCKGVTTVPAGLFNDCINCTNISYVFQSCDHVVSFGAGLFNTFATKLTNMRNSFSGCNAMTSDVNSVFSASSYSAVTQCDYAFDSNYVMTGYGNTFIAKIPSTATHTGCFTNCGSLSDWGSLPSGWY